MKREKGPKDMDEQMRNMSLLSKLPQWGYSSATAKNSPAKTEKALFDKF